MVGENWTVTCKIVLGILNIILRVCLNSKENVDRIVLAGNQVTSGSAWVRAHKYREPRNSPVTVLHHSPNLPPLHA